MDFTKRDTSIGKGIAIGLMIIHHLFNSEAKYSPLIVIFVLLPSLTSSVIIEKLRGIVFQRIAKKDIKGTD